MICCAATMGFYVRKSVRAGPFRFNLSKSGLGVSAGVPGFRVGTGPRGNYVHAGRNGVYYRASLGPSRAQHRSPQAAAGRVPAHAAPPLIAEVLLEDATGASATELVPTGPGDLVEQLNEASRRVPLSPFLLAAMFAALVAKPAVGGVVFIVALPVLVWLWLRDRARRKVVAFFDVNDDVAVWFQRVVDALASAGRVSNIWRINASGRVTTTYQQKVNAGASTLINRAGVRLGSAGPKILATNITVPTISCGRRALHFLPDRVLVSDGRRFSDVAYSALRVSASPTRFIETDRVPRDSRQVDTTWRFVNKGGGPDRRFNNNRKLPIMLYGRLELASPTGLHWTLDVSQPDVASIVAAAVAAAPRSLDKTSADATAAPTGEPRRPVGPNQTATRLAAPRTATLGPPGSSNDRLSGLASTIVRSNPDLPAESISSLTAEPQTYPVCVTLSEILPQDEVVACIAAGQDRAGQPMALAITSRRILLMNPTLPSKRIELALDDVTGAHRESPNRPGAPIVRLHLTSNAADLSIDVQPGTAGAVWPLIQGQFDRARRQAPLADLR